MIQDKLKELSQRTVYLDTQYLDLLRRALNGADTPAENERTGFGTYGGYISSIEIPWTSSGLLSCRYINPKAVVAELCWFLSGSTNINDLDSKIWDQWADENGSIGPMYGKQLRNVPNNKTGERVDQLKRLIHGLENNPSSRRHLISTFNAQDIDDMALWPCHGLVTQFFVSGTNLNMFTYQRSADLLVGLPFNLASYTLLLKLIAREVNMTPGNIYYQIGDYHIYKNQIESMEKWLEKAALAKPSDDPMPYGAWNISPDFDLFEPIDDLITIEGYHPLTKASFPVNV